MSAKIVITTHSVSLFEQIVEMLRSLGVTDTSIGVLASDKTLLFADDDLMQNNASLAVSCGVTKGALLGIVAGLGIKLAAPGIVIGGAALVNANLGNTSFAALASELIGRSVPNIHLQEYQEALEHGELLLIVDVPDEHEQSIKHTISQCFPSLRLEGEPLNTTPIV